MSILSQVNAINDQQKSLEIQKKDLKCQSFAALPAFEFITASGKTVSVQSITADGDGLMTINYSVGGVLDISRIKNPPILVEDAQGTIVQSYTKEDGTPYTRTFREDPKAIVVQNLTSIVK